MVAAARLAVANNLLAEGESDKIYQLLTSYKMVVEVPDNLDRKRIKKYLLADKKVVSGKLFFVLPTRIGGTIITDRVTGEQIDQVLN